MSQTARASDLVTISSPPRARKILKLVAAQTDRKISDLIGEAAEHIAQKYNLQLPAETKEPEALNG